MVTDRLLRRRRANETSFAVSWDGVLDFFKVFWPYWGAFFFLVFHVAIRPKRQSDRESIATLAGPNIYTLTAILYKILDIGS